MKPHSILIKQPAQVTEQAVITIYDWIQQGIYPVGTALPSQRELALHLGISRASLREALTRLAALGQLKILAGKGVYVTALESQPVEQWNQTHSVSLKDFYQLRYVLESFCAMLACHYLIEKDQQLFKSHFEQLTVAIEQQNWQEAAVHDHRFHQRILELSHNPSVVQILKNQTDALKQSQVLPFIQPSLAHQTILEHQHILDALCARDSLAAEQAMKKHVICAAQRAGVYFLSHQS